MSDHALETCPRCGAALEAGFAHTAIGLSFVAPQKLALAGAQRFALVQGYLLTLLARFLLLLGCAPFLLRWAATADTERRLRSPATAGVQLSPRVEITRGADELDIRIGPAGPLGRLL